MKMINDSQLAGISNMKELRFAKRRVNRAIRRIDNNLRDEYVTAKEMFSWADAVCYGFSIVDNIQSIVRYFGKGIQGAISSFGRRRKCRYRD